jgi:hypothetical protein
MSKTVAISDGAYDNLVLRAEAQGFSSVEAFLEQWASVSSDASRSDAVDRIRQVQAEILAKYGPMSDSTELIREDRNR